MSDILVQDAILSATTLNECSTCKHPRGNHPNDKKCAAQGCTCQAFTE
ncbi:MAG: hypothetical protein NWE93_08275 [Candidatus Bathyarchaeota archaeon]|nr:hypothetical protein [Candidatus Bathyarchaeota archaeon]